MALPGLVGTDHIGFTVPDLDEADDFFVDVLGCTHVYSLGPVRARRRLDARAPRTSTRAP